MANNKFVYQQQTNVSVNKSKLRWIASHPDLKKTDYKVILVLLTQLNGYNKPPTSKVTDPENFSYVHIDSIATALSVSKKKIKESLDKLVELEIIEQGDGDAVHDGYRFTF
jgi:RIO-like serine/threonine protein kinase